MRFFRITSKNRRRTVYSITGGVAFRLVISVLMYIVAPLSTSSRKPHRPALSWPHHADERGDRSD